MRNGECQARTSFGLVIERCGEATLPRMVVCAKHATPDAVRIVTAQMEAEIAALKRRLARAKKKAAK